MSNLISICDEYIDIFPLANLMLVGFPNFLIVGKPQYKKGKLSFEKYSYVKIRSCDIETWYNYLCQILILDNSQCTPSREIIISGIDFSYEVQISLNASNNMLIQIILNGNKSFEHVLYLEKNEIMFWLNGISELNFKILCYPETINNCFDYIVSNFLKYDQSIDEVSKIIALLTPDNLIQLCDKFCTKNRLDENPFSMFQILFRHIVQLLITFRIKKSKYTSSSLITFYQNL